MEDDSVKLLRECNAGIKMGISSIDDVMDHVQNDGLRGVLKDSHDIHCRLGDKYVYENMSKTGNCLGGEQSGHIIFSKYATTGDGILTSMKMMEVILAKKLPLSKLAEPVTIYPQVLKNVRVKSKPEAQNDPDVQEAVAKVAEMLGDTGRILVRESGTEPVIRVMVEAETESLCEKYVDQVIDVIKSKGHTA